jgi:hypothetical protein
MRAERDADRSFAVKEPARSHRLAQFFENGRRQHFVGREQFVVVRDCAFAKIAVRGSVCLGVCSHLVFHLLGFILADAPGRACRLLLFMNHFLRSANGLLKEGTWFSGARRVDLSPGQKLF